MPGVQLAKLTQQTEHLAESLNQPDAFVHELRVLLEFYSDRTYHAGENVRSSLRLPSYHLPRIVLQNIQLMLVRQTKNLAAENGMEIAEKLWQEPFYEGRLLATIILGNLQEAFPGIIIEKITSWIDEPIDPILIKDLLVNGSKTLRLHSRRLWLDTISNLSVSSNSSKSTAGLLALLPMIQDPSFKDLPAIFTILTPLVGHPRGEILPELLEILSALLTRSKIETSTFLAQTIKEPHNTNLTRIVRKLLPLFDETQQMRLRLLLEEEKAQIRLDKALPAPATAIQRKQRKT